MCEGEHDARAMCLIATSDERARRLSGAAPTSRVVRRSLGARAKTIGAGLVLFATRVPALLVLALALDLDPSRAGCPGVATRLLCFLWVYLAACVGLLALLGAWIGGRLRRRRAWILPVDLAHRCWAMAFVAAGLRPAAGGRREELVTPAGVHVLVRHAASSCCRLLLGARAAARYAPLSGGRRGPAPSILAGRRLPNFVRRGTGEAVERESARARGRDGSREGTRFTPERRGAQRIAERDPARG